MVVHPGASVPARAISADLAATLVGRLVDDGWGVVVTGSRAERGLAANVAGSPRRSGVVNLAGHLGLPGLAAVLDGAEVVVCGNPGPAHLAAAVGTPVAEVFAPVVPASRWRPWGVPSILLGDQGVPCAGCRTRCCPYEHQPCTAGITADEVVDAVRTLAACVVAMPG
jgi:heptosyltransferase III